MESIKSFISEIGNPLVPFTEKKYGYFLSGRVGLTSILLGNVLGFMFQKI